MCIYYTYTHTHTYIHKHTHTYAYMRIHTSMAIKFTKDIYPSNKTISYKINR